jgi:hypothetical protein
LSSSNDLLSNLIFTLEQEENNNVNVLDIAVSEREGKIKQKSIAKRLPQTVLSQQTLVTQMNKRTQALHSL